MSGPPTRLTFMAGGAFWNVPSAGLASTRVQHTISVPRPVSDAGTGERPPAGRRGGPIEMRATIAGTRLSARLTAIGCAAITVLASASISACSGSSPSATPPTLSPGGTPTRTRPATPTASPSGTATATTTPSATPTASATATRTHSPSPSPSPTPSRASPFPTVAPATGGGGTAGFQDTLLLGLGGAAILAGAGSIAYRRRVIRSR